MMGDEAITELRRRIEELGQTLDRYEAMKNLRLQGWTLQEIGDEFGISRERVRVILRGLPRGKHNGKDKDNGG